ncbi:MAG: N-acetylmuramic acid 6-phosphate etherase [Hyphomonadaceae bacterium]|nr:MAG: N-acetylmuramic acid 6-phosphate etherase [Hyphomonadaceae bacterium]
MSTEDLDTNFIDIDKWTSSEAIAAMATGQFAALEAVKAASSALGQAVDAAKQRLENSKGRLAYVGAGTSGRVAVQDGVELNPTFGWPWERLVFAMAGGTVALMQAVENAEDDVEAGAHAMQDANIGKDDVVIGVAASGKTPYTLSAMRAAKANGALTIGISNNPNTPLLEIAEIGILLETGPEPLAGSTRLKAGTSQKIALNLFSTALMIAMGGAYNGYMVGMIATNAKLRARATQIVKSLTNVSQEVAADAVVQAQGNLKIAVLIALGLGSEKCGDLLALSHGNLREAIKRASL